MQVCDDRQLVEERDRSCVDLAASISAVTPEMNVHEVQARAYRVNLAESFVKRSHLLLALID